MKSILIVIYAHYVKLIIEGKKTVEVRKNKNLANAIKKLIAEQGGCWIYIYVAKDNKVHKLYDMLVNQCMNGYHKVHKPYFAKPCFNYNETCLNGKVVARFWCDKVEDIKCNFIAFSFEKYITETLNTEQLEKLSCLTRQELSNYIGNVNVSLGQTRGYAIHISKLEVFDRPRELNEFHKIVNIRKCDTRYCDDYYTCNKCVHSKLTKAPQNYCYIESEE